MTRKQTSSAGPRPYKPLASSQKPARPTDIAPSLPVRRGKTTILIGGILVGGISYYALHIYRTISAPQPAIPQDFDVSSRYNTTASTFDEDVDFTEWYTGINSMRKQLVQQARGNVLEAAVGTGRNINFYDLSRLKSVTLLDQSKEMVDVTRKKWQKTHPQFEDCRFVVRSALDPSPLPPPPGTDGEREDDGYDTIIATMSLCSTPGPSLFLRNLASYLAFRQLAIRTKPIDPEYAGYPSQSRILLLEHGRSYYSWLNKLMDRTAPAHAVKHGCWWNRDIGQIAEDSGLDIISMQRKHFGTSWILELGLPEEAKGKGRQRWLEDTRRKIASLHTDLKGEGQGMDVASREADAARRQGEELEQWRKAQREEMQKRNS
ncbi:MAG: hypothetical protein Q9220_000197 [cf. Caloplaca sp. 1 TL-2023]